jgi:hypothetical protein
MRRSAIGARSRCVAFSSTFLRRPSGGSCGAGCTSISSREISVDDLLLRAGGHTMSMATVYGDGVHGGRTLGPWTKHAPHCAVCARDESLLNCHPPRPPSTCARSPPRPPSTCARSPPRPSSTCARSPPRPSSPCARPGPLDKTSTVHGHHSTKHRAKHRAHHRANHQTSYARCANVGYFMDFRSHFALGFAPPH